MKIATFQAPLYNQVGNYHWKWDRNSFAKLFMSIIEAWSITGNDDVGIEWIFNELDDENGRGWVVEIIENETLWSGWKWMRGVDKCGKIIIYAKIFHHFKYKSFKIWSFSAKKIN